MRAIRARTRADYDASAVLLAIGSLSIESEDEGHTLLGGVSVTEIAETVGIPRETVRRKTMQLLEAGLVRRSHGSFMIADVTEWKKLAAEIETP